MGKTATRPKIDLRLLPGEIRCLWLTGPPLLVMAMAGLIFEVAASDLSGLQARVATVLTNTVSLDTLFGLAETRARLIWGATVLISGLAGLALIVASLWVLGRSLSRAGLCLYGGLALALSVGGVFHLIDSGRTASSLAAIFTFTYDSLVQSRYLAGDDLAAVAALVQGLNILGVVAPAFALMAGCATLSRGLADTGTGQAKSDLTRLQSRMRRLKRLLNLGSAVLVIGILHMIVWIRWPAALVSDHAVAQEILGLSTALGVYWGATYTLLIVAFYVPASFVISRRAERAIARCPEQAGGLDARAWMKSVGLSVTPTQQLPQIAAMMAPLLAGPVGGLLNNLVDPLGGG